jgi:hypothetical protein
MKVLLPLGAVTQYLRRLQQEQVPSPTQLSAPGERSDEVNTNRHLRQSQSSQTNSPITLELSPVHESTPSQASLEIRVRPVSNAQLTTPRQLELEMDAFPIDPIQLGY